MNDENLDWTVEAAGVQPSETHPLEFVWIDYAHAVDQQLDRLDCDEDAS